MHGIVSLTCMGAWESPPTRRLGGPSTPLFGDKRPFLRFVPATSGESMPAREFCAAYSENPTQLVCLGGSTAQPTTSWWLPLHSVVLLPPGV